MVPLVNSVAEAAEAVSYCRFPPQGCRSLVAPSRAILVQVRSGRVARLPEGGLLEGRKGGAGAGGVARPRTGSGCCER